MKKGGGSLYLCSLRTLLSCSVPAPAVVAPTVSAVGPFSIPAAAASPDVL